MLWRSISGYPRYVPVPSISTAVNPSCYDTPSGYPCTYQPLPLLLWTHHVMTLHQDTQVCTSPFHFHCCEPIMLWHAIMIPLYVPAPSISTAMNPSCYDTPSGYPCTYQPLPFPLLWTHHVMTHHQDTPVRTSPFHFHCYEPIMLWHAIMIPLYVPVPSISTAVNLLHNDTSWFEDSCVPLEHLQCPDTTLPPA